MGEWKDLERCWVAINYPAEASSLLIRVGSASLHLCVRTFGGLALTNDRGANKAVKIQTNAAPSVRWQLHLCTYRIDLVLLASPGAIAPINR